MRWPVLIAAVALGCTRPARDERAASREEARAVLRAHCGACHTGHLKTAVAGATEVFDLDEREWAARMSNAQLGNASWRLGEPLPPDGAPNDVTPAERQRFDRYVGDEKAARAAAPACPPDDLLEAIHAATFHLEHGGPGRVGDVVRGPVDETTRDLLAQLAHAARAVDPRPFTEEIRAQLADWPCLTPAKHQRFHQQL